MAARSTPPDVQVIVGTSAGSVLAAAIRSGVGTRALLDHQRAAPIPALPGIAEIEGDSGRFPLIPRPRRGSPRLLAASAFAPHRFRPHVAANALVLEGRAWHDAMGGNLMDGRRRMLVLETSLHTPSGASRLRLRAA
jgi:NTE family protein